MSQQGEIGFSASQSDVNSKEQTKDKIMQMLRERFKPEFLNRVDDIIMFESLSKSDLGKIVNMQLNQIKQRLSEKQIDIAFTENLQKYLAGKGYDPAYGARPLKRVIQNEILDELAMQIVTDKIPEQKSITVDFIEGKVAFK